MADRAKRKVGRPSTKDRAVKVEFELDREQADFLEALGRRHGWGLTHHAAAKTLVVSEITALQRAALLAHPERLPDKS